MGGTAFGHQAPRMSAAVFNIKAASVIREIRKYASMCAIITTYAEKETFGDIDILVSDDFDFEAFRANQQLDSEMQYTSDGIANNAVSMLYGGNQVDLIFVHVNKFTSHLCYMCNDPMGMLLGVLAKQIGMRYGHHGLSVSLTDCDKNYFPRDIQVTNDHATIMRMLGFRQMQMSFTDIYDIFNLITTSDLFTPSIFKLDNLNNKNRERNKKRKTYCDFVAYTSEYPEKEVPLYTMSEALRYANQFNPKILEKFKKLNDDYHNHLIYTLKFNGKIVSELTGVTGKNLSNLMEYMNTKHKHMFIKEIIIPCTENYIPTVVKEIHKEWLNVSETV